MKTKRFKVLFESLSPVLFCKPYHLEIPKEKGEKPDEYEERTWKERAWYTKNEIVIPARMFQATLEPMGKLSGERVGGGKMGKSVAHYLAGVKIAGEIRTKVTKKKVQPHPAFVSATGQPGGPKVLRMYPQVNKWKGVLEISYVDLNLGVLNPKVIVDTFNAAGQLIGIGHWRPGSPSRGEYGLFKCKKV